MLGNRCQWPSQVLGLCFSEFHPGLPTDALSCPRLNLRKRRRMFLYGVTSQSCTLGCHYVAIKAVLTVPLHAVQKDSTSQRCTIKTNASWSVDSSSIHIYQTPIIAHVLRAQNLSHPCRLQSLYSLCCPSSVPTALYPFPITYQVSFFSMSF